MDAAEDSYIAYRITCIVKMPSATPMKSHSGQIAFLHPRGELLYLTANALSSYIIPRLPDGTQGTCNDASLNRVLSCAEMLKASMVISREFCH